MSKSAKIIIALDNGKMNIKAKSEEKEIKYLNRYADGHSEDESMLGDYTFNVTSRNKCYTVGNKCYLSDKNEGKASDIQIVQALTAITRFIEKNERRDIILTYGESADMYFNGEHKLKIKQALEGNHEVFINGCCYSFNIETVQILPEGIGHILQDLKKFKGVQYVVDIGGGTINILVVVDGRPDPKRCRSYSLGVNNVVDKIVVELKRKGFGDYSQNTDLILQFLNKRETCKNIKVLEVIDEVVIGHFVEIDTLIAGFLDIHKVIKVQPVMFLGGGSELFKHQINKHYKSDVIDNLVVEDALFANVRGFYEYAKAKFAPKGWYQSA